MITIIIILAPILMAINVRRIRLERLLFLFRANPLGTYYIYRLGESPEFKMRSRLKTLIFI